MDQALKQWLTGRKRGEDGNTKIWLSRVRKELFRWNKKHFSYFLKGYHLVKNKKWWKIADTSFNFKHISHLFLVFQLLTLNSWLFAGIKIVQQSPGGILQRNYFENYPWKQNYSQMSQENTYSSFSIKFQSSLQLISPFCTTDIFLYPPKTLESLCFSVFRRYRKWSMVSNG